MKIITITKEKILVTLLAFALAGGSVFAAVSPAKQLEKGKQLYAQNKDDEAMDAFIDVLVNGSRAEVEEANKYVNLIHSRIGGIQDPIEVDVNFKEGEAKRLEAAKDPAVLEEQLNAETAAIEEEVKEAAAPATAQADAAALAAQKAQEEAAAQAALAAQKAQEEAAAQAALAQKEQELLKEQAREQALKMQGVADQETEEAKLEQQQTNSTFVDLTTPAALKARQIYTSQKLENMKAAAIAKLEKTKGVRVYFRNGLPDAIDIDSEILFNGYKFRPEALPVLDQVYTLMALTQGAGYIILPPGSYTDNITLSGIRQAMALNSFLVHKGLSSGKISYNMGLFDQEPPAKFANLEGVSIVFDFDADLPSALPDATSVSKLPMLSMAVVPVSNKIDPSAGEAFAIDFSVIETQNPLDNWVFQVVQHAADGSYYVVRQLEGFSPVYHQIVWNGRKGIIGPELACGTYTLALTAADVQGGKRTIRRQVEVACKGAAADKAKAAAKDTENADAAKLDYKTARLWTKPNRVMKGAAVAEPEAEPAAEPEAVDPFATDNAQAAPAAVDYNNYGGTNNAAQPAPANTQANVPAQGVANPYDMPYDEYGN
ncbi:MAG: hypothetical protein IKN49_01540 [Elusimicrobiaceae bacterium]|nr:hypothetical protein [Elusimicrobiaceae bacterium]